MISSNLFILGSLGAVVFIIALFLLFFIVWNQSKKMDLILAKTDPINTSLLNFVKDLGEIKASSSQINLIRTELNQNLAQSLDRQTQNLKPLSQGVDHLLNYFGGLRSSAGKVGELTFDLLIEGMPPGHILKNITFENQGRLEFLLKVGEDWVPIDSKFSENPKVYFKKAVKDVSSKYLGQKILKAADSGDSEIVSGKVAASYGIVFFPSDEALFEVYKQQDLRTLMFEKRVWAVSPSNLYWQLFFLQWMEKQADRASDASLIINSMNMSLVEVDNSLRNLELVEKQIRQSLLNFEKTKKSLNKVKGFFNKY